MIFATEFSGDTMDTNGADVGADKAAYKSFPDPETRAAQRWRFVRSIHPEIE